MQQQYLEEFLDVGMRSSAFVAASDGTAFWSNQGFVGVRYPAAAGDGSDGDLRWGESAAAQRVQAASFVVPEGKATRWDGGDGLCVIASQSALEIAGSLVREGGPRRVPPPPVAATATGRERSVVDESPNCPFSFAPQTAAVPSEHSARL